MWFAWYVNKNADGSLINAVVYRADTEDKLPSNLSQRAEGGMFGIAGGEPFVSNISFLAGVQKKADTLAAERDALLLSCEACAKKCDALMIVRASLLSAGNDLTVQRDDAQYEKVRLLAEIEAMTQERDDERNALAAMAKEQDALVEMIKNLQSHVIDLNEKLKEAVEWRDAWEKAHDALALKHNTMAAERDALAEKLKEAAAEIVSLKHAYTNSITSIAALSDWPASIRPCGADLSRHEPETMRLGRNMDGSGGLDVKVVATGAGAGETITIPGNASLTDHRQQWSWVVSGGVMSLQGTTVRITQGPGMIFYIHGGSPDDEVLRSMPGPLADVMRFVEQWVADLRRMGLTP